MQHELSELAKMPDLGKTIFFYIGKTEVWYSEQLGYEVSTDETIGVDLHITPYNEQDPELTILHNVNSFGYAEAPIVNTLATQITMNIAPDSNIEDTVQEIWGSLVGQSAGELVLAKIQETQEKTTITSVPVAETMYMDMEGNCAVREITDLYDISTHIM